MSEQQTVLGKVRLLDLEGDTIEEKCSKLAETLWEGSVEDYNTAKDYILDEYGERFLIVQNNIYEMFDIKNMYGDDFVNLTQNSDGTYSFVTTFYNGGTYLQEVLENGLKNL